MRTEMKEIIHHGYIGIEKTKRNTRDTIYWPNINAEIADMISTCSTCIEPQNNQQRETLMSYDIPELPWVNVGADLFTLFNDNYVIVVDYHSKCSKFL